jgi:hypothetical protein
MTTASLTIGMKVRHPAYGVGTVRSITEHTAEVRFEDGSMRTVSPDGSALQPAEPTAEITGLEIPLASLIKRVVESVADALGLEQPDTAAVELAGRWNGGRMVLHPADTSLQPKEVSLETFFHKIVMMRNQLRVLEQKLNAHEKLTDEEKVEMQQYITRCYGSMTTFNILFREKEGGF